MTTPPRPLRNPRACSQSSSSRHSRFSEIAAGILVCGLSVALVIGALALAVKFWGWVL